MDRPGPIVAAFVSIVVLYGGGALIYLFVHLWRR